MLNVVMPNVIMIIFVMLSAILGVVMINAIMVSVLMLVLWHQQSIKLITPNCELRFKKFVVYIRVLSYRVWATKKFLIQLRFIVVDNVQTIAMCYKNYYGRNLRIFGIS